MTAKWQGGKTYVPGDIVRPTSSAAPSVTQPDNASFETGDFTGWSTSDPGKWSISSMGPYSGSYSAIASGGGTTEQLSDTHLPIHPGSLLSAVARISLTNAGTDDLGALIGINWYTAADAQIGTTNKGSVVYGKGGFWTQSSVSYVAPEGASYARLVLVADTGSHGGNLNFDGVTVTSSYKGPTPGLVYKATQADPGKSAANEPSWPGVIGVPVTDNDVTWEGVIATRIIWKAVPLLKSGDTEPTWPEATDATVRDGTIDWVASTAQVTDSNCPQSKVVAIMASKVFAADGDIVRFSATINPLDWTSSQDAGYLPTGLQQANANDMAVLAPYRSNLTTFNASSFQNWQVDPDPSAMSILDQLEGIGSSWQHAAQPVGNDLFYLSQLGVRSISMAGGTDSLSSGDIGMPIDSLVRPAVVADDTLLGPRATYYPSAGQYWLAVGGPSPQTFVITMNGGKPKCSRNIFPWSVDAFAQLGNDLYIRHGDEVSVVSESANTDDVAGVPTNFTGLVQWAWLDNGQPGVTKMLESLDYVGSGQGPSLSIGYDQRSTSAFTDPYLIEDDTLPGAPIPMPVAAPTFSIKLDFAGGSAWGVNAVTLHLSNMAGNP